MMTYGRNTALEKYTRGVIESNIVKFLVLNLSDSLNELQCLSKFTVSAVYLEPTLLIF